MSPPVAQRALLACIARMGLFCIAATCAHSQASLTSDDGYIRKEGNEWIFGTALTERRVRLGDGRLTQTSVLNKRSGVEHRAAADQPAQITFFADGKDTVAAGWQWILREDRASRGAQGELQLDIELASAGLIATQHYLIFPGTAVVREWLSLKNASDRSVRLGQVGFLNARVSYPQVSDVRFNYLTGGGNYNGSQLLKSESANGLGRRSIDSNGGAQATSYSGYLPLIFLHDRNSNEGVAVGWDYLGHWRLNVGNRPGGGFDMQLELAGFEKDLAPGAQIETPMAFIATFSGGVDDLGNQLLDWQYGYLWDFTQSDYFAKTRWAVDWPDPWIGEGGTPSADNWGRRLALDLRYIDLLRETGTDILWDDAGWYDRWGSWTAPDWRRTTNYLRKHEMKWVLWYPTFLATPESRVGQQHPDWLVPRQKFLEQSIPATVEWQSRLLDESVAAWGDYQWRYDIAPAASANDTDSLAADQNFRSVLRQFKTRHPASGIDACHGGGRWISYEIARMAESGEYTDGGVGPYSAYYTSLLVPPDKLHNVVDFDHTYYVEASDRIHLAMNPTWYRDPGDGVDIEAIRKDWEIYHYMVAQGVAGRWSHVFRPDVEHDDPVWYFQRMNRDGSKGMILTKHAKQGAGYFVISKLKSSPQPSDRYRGGAGDMSMVTTTAAASVKTGVYEDFVDGASRFYGVPGQGFGPLNVKYQVDGQQRSLVTNIVRLGAERKVDGRSFGMALEPGEPMTITQLGQFDPGRSPGQFEMMGNRGTYTLSLVRAGDGAVLATVDLDMSQGSSDALGFKYAPLREPVRLETSSRPIVIRPRGLLANESYDVRAIHSGLRLREKGSTLMARGITFEKIAPGELVFLNLPGYPGSGEDKVAPVAPSALSKRVASNLGVQGIELSWTAGRDDNWLSYYEVRKNGAVMGRTAKGTFFFDHSDSARNDIDAVFEVCAVDGDGNRSSFATATKAQSEPPTYEALGDFSLLQASHWDYEEELANGSYRALRWDKGGYEGRWAGSGLGRIGRMWMQPSASRNLSRTFVVPTSGVVASSGSVRKDPSASNGVSAFVRILRNSEQVWPATGWAEVRAEPGAPTNYDLSGLRVAAGDKLRFMVKANGQNRADPIVWNPRVVIQVGK